MIKKRLSTSFHHTNFTLKKPEVSFATPLSDEAKYICFTSEIQKYESRFELSSRKCHFQQIGLLFLLTFLAKLLPMNVFFRNCLAGLSILFAVFFGSSCQPDASNGQPLADTTMLNVSYGNHPRQVYDLYLPAARSSSTPTVVLIHGGAWQAGQKEEMNNWVGLIKNQWPQAAILNVNYRLANAQQGIHHAEITNDISQALSQYHVRRNEYRVSGKVGLMGASAGGHLAMLQAYTQNQQGQIQCVSNLFGPSILNDWSWYNSNNPWLGGYVGDVIALYAGATWDTTLYKSISPYSRVAVGSVPTILFHGSLDPIVPLYQSQWMHGRLNQMGIPTAFHEYPAFHSFDANQSADVCQKTVAFFKAHFN